MRIVIGQNLQERLNIHAIQCMPQEACALLLGRVDTDTRILDIITMQNAAARNDRFSISPADLIAAYTQAAERDMDIVGIFHSHPNSEAVPSSLDVYYMGVNNVVWVIRGRDGRLRAWLYDGTIHECDIAREI